MKLVKLNGVCACEAEKPLTEFRLFKPGSNESSKGTYLFDAIAADAVLADYAKHGVDIMIDLEHLSLDSDSPNYNPDALGWCNLEMRGGELWAVNVRWTNQGSWRLTDKSQRYISPAFSVDDANRVTSIVNIALVAMPATHEAQALIAASRLEKLSTENSSMDPNLVKDAFDALMAGDAEKCAEVLKQLLAAQITGEAPVSAAADPAASDAVASSESSQALSIEPAGLDLVVNSLLKATGATDPAEAVKIVETWGAAHAEVVAQKAALELASRRMLIASLVKLGIETPATAWDGDDKDKRVPCKRLAAEPIEELRERVKLLSASPPANQNPRPNLGVNPATLTEKERVLINQRGVSEEVYLSRKREMLARSTINNKKPEAAQ